MFVHETLPLFSQQEFLGSQGFYVGDVSGESSRAFLGSPLTFVLEVKNKEPKNLIFMVETDLFDGLEQTRNRRSLARSKLVDLNKQ